MNYPSRIAVDNAGLERLKNWLDTLPEPTSFGILNVGEVEYHLALIEQQRRTMARIRQRVHQLTGTTWYYAGGALNVNTATWK